MRPSLPEKVGQGIVQVIQGEGRCGSAWSPEIEGRAFLFERVDLDHREIGTAATPQGQGLCAVRKGQRSPRGDY